MRQKQSRSAIRLLLLLFLIADIIFLLWYPGTPKEPSLPYDHLFKPYTEVIPQYTGPSNQNGMPAEKIWIANKGRNVFDQNNKFLFPPSVKRVWIDVGASMLETTRTALIENDDLGLIAVEPLESCWNTWPKNERLIALPIALDDTEGEKIFYQSRKSLFSSLLKGISGGPFEGEREVVKEFPVQVLLLSRVLESIPDHLTIELLKVDVQGRDLNVLQSGGNHIRRVKRIKTEVNLKSLYDGDRGDTQSPEDYFTHYLGEMGFTLIDRQVMEVVTPELNTRTPLYADVVYENTLAVSDTVPTVTMEDE